MEPFEFISYNIAIITAITTAHFWYIGTKKHSNIISSGVIHGIVGFQIGLLSGTGISILCLLLNYFFNCPLSFWIAPIWSFVASIYWHFNLKRED